MNPPLNARLIGLALGVLVLDQVTKLIVRQYLGLHQEVLVVDGFFKLVHWGNTGAAWSLFKDNNHVLSAISLVALAALFLARRFFDVGTPMGQAALGLIFGGILGNVLDRLLRGHVVDFLYFYLYRRSGEELGFPAFNIADTAICTGVGLLFLVSWREDRRQAAAKPAADGPPPPPPPAVPPITEADHGR